jgi:Cu/Ag efflux protein CusF
VKLRVGLLLFVSVSAACRQQTQQAPPATPFPQASATRSAAEMGLPIVGKPYPGKGIVTIINLKEGWIEVNHEAIEGLMPAMQMEWFVKNKSQLRTVHVGDKVDFVVVETGSGEIITDLKPAKP